MNERNFLSFSKQNIIFSLRLYSVSANEKDHFDQRLEKPPRNQTGPHGIATAAGPNFQGSGEAAVILGAHCVQAEAHLAARLIVPRRIT